MKKNPIYKLKVSSHFSSSHQLRNYKGKCENLHGHNFIVEVIVRGSMLDKKVEYLIDFKILKKLLNEIVDPLDHIHLNNYPPFDKINPSSENLAMYIYKEMAKKLEPFENVEIEQVGVAENTGSWAYFMEMEE
ncbi:6-carboxytetrahydropterin synthase QueD [Desulfothermus okinawensis JCM 13304]